MKEIEKNNSFIYLAALRLSSESLSPLKSKQKQIKRPRVLSVMKIDYSSQRRHNNSRRNNSVYQHPN